MSNHKLLGRLPDKPAHMVLVSGEYPMLTESLRQFGIGVVITTPDKRLPGPVQWHSDMQACVIDSEIILLKNSALQDILVKNGISVRETRDTPEPFYPKDVLCNVLAFGRWALGNSETADETILQAANKLGVSWLNVKQGYAACATALVDEHHAITADNGIANQLERHGMQVLRISAGAVKLPGYPYGFIGGCCGKLAPKIMAFAGSLETHPDGMQIKEFLSAQGVQPVELLDGELLDVGGLIALC